jgi:hypothetical protein
VSRQPETAVTEPDIAMVPFDEDILFARAKRINVQWSCESLPSRLTKEDAVVNVTSLFITILKWKKIHAALLKLSRIGLTFPSLIKYVSMAQQGSKLPGTSLVHSPR